MIRLAICMIVKNEAKRLKACLSDIASLCDEIVIVDTGSTDNTIQIAQQFTSKTFCFKWVSDFSKARNFAIEQVSSDWVLALDADELISKADIKQIRSHIQNSVVNAYRIAFKTYSNDDTQLEWQSVDPADLHAQGMMGWFPMYKIVLFQNDPRIRFSGAVHESIEPALRQHQLKFVDSAIQPLHFGFVSDASSKNKLYIQLGLEKIKQAPHNPQNYFECAIHYRNTSHHRKAVSLFKKAIQLDPSFIRAHLELANIYMAQKKYEKAISGLRKVLKQSDDPMVLNNLGNCYFYLEKYDQAIKAYKQAHQQSPTYLRALKNWGICLLKQKNLKQAKQLFEKALHLAPHDFTLLFNLGYLHSQLGNLEKALAYYSKAVMISSTDLQLNINIGNTMYRLNRKPEALCYYETALKLQPNHPVMRINIKAIQDEMSHYGLNQ